MPKIIERDIVEKPVLFVNEDNESYAYSRGYTNSGLPFYTPPKDKNITDGQLLVEEVVFLPITNSQFAENRRDYFFGYRMLFQKTNHSTVNLMSNPKMSVTRFQITFEISRIRYYPSGEKTITIERTYDALFPTQVLNLQFPTTEVADKVIKAVDDIVDAYCTYYIDKKI